MYSVFSLRSVPVKVALQMCDVESRAGTLYPYCLQYTQLAQTIIQVIYGYSISARNFTPHICTVIFVGLLNSIRTL